MAKILTVSQLAAYIKGVFEDELVLTDIAVTGEISEFKTSSGNTFAVITEGGCAVNCVKFAAMEKISPGTAVTVKGSVRYFDKGGRTAFIFTDMTPAGEGEKYVALRRLKEKLDAEGCFASKRALPRLIGRVALITSTTGAVIHDFCSVLNQNPFVDIDVYPCRVQGGNAAEEAAALICKANGSGADVVVLARGGGSALDLDVFNDEKLTRVAAASSIPIISAVGHEVDYTLCDFAADLRAGTPSIAAAMIVENNQRFISAFTELALKAGRALRRVFNETALRLKISVDGAGIAGSEKLADCRMRLYRGSRRAGDSLESRLRSVSGKLGGFCMSGAARATERVGALECRLTLDASRLSGANPLRILSRGYARVTSEGRDADVSELKPGSAVRIYFGNGTADAEVTKVIKSVGGKYAAGKENGGTRGACQ